MSDANTEAIASAEVSHIIIRGCACGSPRTPDVPCAGCGNTEPPEIVNLGVVTAHYRNPFRQALWVCVRKPLAELRIRRANRRALSTER